MFARNRFFFSLAALYLQYSVSHWRKYNKRHHIYTHNICTLCKHTTRMVHELKFKTTEMIWAHIVEDDDAISQMLTRFGYIAYVVLPLSTSLSLISFIPLYLSCPQWRFRRTKKKKIKKKKICVIHWSADQCILFHFYFYFNNYCKCTFKTYFSWIRIFAQFNCITKEKCNVCDIRFAVVSLFFFESINSIGFSTHCFY